MVVHGMVMGIVSVTTWSPREHAVDGLGAHRRVQEDAGQRDPSGMECDSDCDTHGPSSSIGCHQHCPLAAAERKPPAGLIRNLLAISLTDVAK
jgi:hypothetical protein